MGLTRVSVVDADVKSLQKFLQSGSVKSTALVDAYLAQIDRHDGYLHAMLSMPTRESIKNIAIALDEERAAGKVRSPVHGIPVIIKLVAAGMIILGKANLSELSNFRGKLLTSGWSALGGQCQSPYVRGGVVPGDSTDGHSNPSGSSSGSAVVVAAGYSPISVGTETYGSLVCPANRASLYTLKPTIGLISQTGIIPVSHTMDSAGPMAKTPYDIAAFLDMLREDGTPGFPDGGYTTVLPCSMDKISVATVDYTEWIFPAEYIKPDENATEQMKAYDKIKSVARKYSDRVPLIKPETFLLNGKSSMEMVTLTDFRHDFQKYLDDLESRPIDSLQELIDFNREHADVELPPGMFWPLLIYVDILTRCEKEYGAHLANLRQMSRDKGIDYILKNYDADVIIGPADSTLMTLASAAGYPVASLPLGYLDLNGRAFGIAALAGQHQEATLIRFMDAWDSTFHPHKPPPMLVDNSSGFDIN
ncbi:hypothetical protein B7494_g3015 [Chlorociboria aeruginascens]|nr:hypothetical protein B7494_g3015 [Chlorociboria aeruginascens]